MAAALLVMKSWHTSTQDIESIYVHRMERLGLPPLHEVVAL